MLKLIVQYNNKKPVSLVLIFFLLTLIPKHCPTQYPHLPDYPPQFSADVTTISQNSPQAEVTKVYRDNNKQRIETTINGTKIVTIILIDEQKSIQLEPDTKSYFYLSVDTTEFQRFIDPSLRYTMFSGAKYTLVSQEIIDGQACDKYQIIVTNEGELKGSRLYKTQKNPVFCPTTKRLEACGTMRGDFPRCVVYHVRNRK
jgi:hypothetical protein